MELILAFLVLTAGAVLALRSATSPKPVDEESPATEVVPEEEAGLDTEPWSAGELLADADNPNGQGAATAADPDATLTGTAMPPVAPAAGAVTAATITVRPEPATITEDRRLDDVLTAATEETPPPPRPAVRLLIAITGLALAFAAALLLVVRGVQALWNGFFG